MNQEKGPYVSVVVCAYNGKKFVQSCLSGLVKQIARSNEYEVLIIDDESMDSTFDIASDFINSQKNNSLHMRLVRIRHGGLSVARNTGIQLSKGEIIAFIDQDAVADKYWVAEILKAWEAVPDADAIGGKIEILNTRNRTAQFLYTAYYEPTDRYGIIGANMSFKKKQLLQIGAFGDPFKSRGDDTFLLFKMGKYRKEVKWPAARVFHDHPNSLRQWMKERTSNGEMSRLISRILDEQQYLLRSFLLKRLVAVLLVVGVAVGFSFKALWGLLLLPGLFLVKGIRQGVYKRFHEKYSSWAVPLLTIFWQLLDEVGIWMFCFGRWCGSRIQFTKEHAMCGTVSDKFIIDEVSNW